jgi:hypothetical protein
MMPGLATIDEIVQWMVEMLISVMMQLVNAVM